MKDATTLLQAAQSILAPWAKEFTYPDPMRLDVALAAGDIAPAAAALRAAGWGYLTAITGLDLGVEAGKLEVLYHFCDGPALVNLRVTLPRDNPVINSVCGAIPSASFFERELSEMFGVTVAGTPNPDKLFLPEDWPDGVYPLRKDFEPELLTRGRP
ncbi:MAG: NADH-quinone oxidoreductase subunit C [Anaerolineae bacterium]|nr:NADH-quinone oxidoreductase subunit C [Thermoflexales bacterium]MDW8407354.1 NADH-quinone oxidoreductase subunit C [Anaerolineae bacterium]